MILIWFWYDFDMISLWFWSAFEFLIWFCYGVRRVFACWSGVLCCQLGRVLPADRHGSNPSKHWAFGGGNISFGTLPGQRHFWLQALAATKKILTVAGQNFTPAWSLARTEPFSKPGSRFDLKKKSVIRACMLSQNRSLETRKMKAWAPSLQLCTVSWLKPYFFQCFLSLITSLLFVSVLNKLFLNTWRGSSSISCQYSMKLVIGTWKNMKLIEKMYLQLYLYCNKE